MKARALIDAHTESYKICDNCLLGTMEYQGILEYHVMIVHALGPSADMMPQDVSLKGGISLKGALTICNDNFPVSLKGVLTICNDIADSRAMLLY